ncbi:MAG: HU family DNA-binding protein [Candidatus Saganbacteria bacterium]|nr:HU family DNA-binding protein [Candidatus Saganbacteria bacterium]
MNKKQLAAKVGRKMNLTKAESERIIDATLEAITDSLKDGKKVRLVGFGNFVVRTRKGRVGRNPQTGATITIGSTKGPAFVPGINLKKVVKAQ